MVDLRVFSDCDLALLIEHGKTHNLPSLKAPTGDLIYYDASGLAQRTNLADAQYLPLIPEVVSDPFEIWLTFEKHHVTGKVDLLQRIVKSVDVEQKTVGLVLVAIAWQAKLHALRLIATNDRDDLNTFRVGRLLWARDRDLEST
ncbi:MAG TPA: PBECR2 nuclease fold domain-containing protein [Candidatus Cybelea sp.]|nr:PBECR2 nuclease fold domain-containing protein [Candidatus Cybelea sp.]